MIPAQLIPFVRLCAVCTLLWSLAGPAYAQSAPAAPQRERLLNGLPVLLWSRPGDAQVLLNLRVHSGAAFDLAGKEGLMTLLGDVLFPDPSTREFVADELGGRLVVTTTYDYIDVRLSGRAAEFERLAELLRNAVVNTRVTADDVTRLRAERIEQTRAASAAPATRADRAVAARLYGAHPYGRPLAGTPESLARIDRNDLLLARDRFLTADNAELVVVGGVEPERAMRAFRQFLGAWRKSEALVPATFRQPEAPDARTLVIDVPAAPAAEVRLALRGLAHTDSDYVAAQVLAALARARWTAALQDVNPAAVAVRHDTHALGGLWLMSAQVAPERAARALDAARAVLRDLAAAPPTTAELATAELERARTTAMPEDPQPARADEALATDWLDADSYRLAPGAEARALAALTPAAVQRVAARLFRTAPVASVAVGPAAQLRPELAKTSAGVELLGAPLVEPPKPKPAPSPAPGRRP